MSLWESYAQAFREVAPSRILGVFIKGNKLPGDWTRLSSYPVTDGEVEEFVLKHPISAKDKKLKYLSGFWRTASREDKERFLDALADAEDAVARVIESSPSIEDFARLWNDLPEKLKEEYAKAIREGGFNNAAEIAEELVHLPADPRVPDHDWLSRLDVYAQLREGNVKLLRFKLSPVQGFIANARTERDLWAGSHMLSLLTYLAISELWHSFGPHSLVLPHLRGQPFFEHEIGTGASSAGSGLEIANMPNKVLAIVPGDTNVDKLRQKIDEKLRAFLKNLFHAAWKFYRMGEFFDLKGIYEQTVKKYFSITVETIPLTKLSDIIEESLKAYLEKLPDNFEREVHHYPELFALLDQYTDFSSARHERPEQPMGFKCTLCGENLAIGGEYRYNPLTKKWDDLRKELWGQGIYDIKDKEYLCPLCLTKRFYPRFYSLWESDYSWVKENPDGVYNGVKAAGPVGLKRFRSVSEVAMRMPTKRSIELKKKGKLMVEPEKRAVTWYDVFLYVVFETGSAWEWRKKVTKPGFSGTFKEKFEEQLRRLAVAVMPLFVRLSPNIELFYVENAMDGDSIAKIYGVKDIPSGVDPKRIQAALLAVSDLIGEPPKYYAILKMDGDNMGKVLSGAKAVKDVREYTLSGVPVNVSRPVTPVIHTAITRSLSRFAVTSVPSVSETHDAELLYAGGDDVLALVPTDVAFALAYDIQGEFSENWMGYEPLQGETRSMSGGLLILYYKEPLYSTIPDVERLEHRAKESGRNGLAVGYRKHSGAFYRVPVNWELFEGSHHLSLIDAIKAGDVSRKLIYELDTMEWPNDPVAVLNLLKYEFTRHSEYGKKRREELVNRLAEFLWLVRNVRVVVTKHDLGGNPDENALREINEKIRTIIAADPEDSAVEPFESIREIADELVKKGDVEENTMDGLWLGKLSSKLGNELAGLVLKKQVHGAAVLLKVLLESGVGA